jgi:hypothetical protein
MFHNKDAKQANFTEKFSTITGTDQTSVKLSVSQEAYYPYRKHTPKPPLG